MESFVRKVAGLDPCLVVLYGSLAKEDFTDFSDADVLVCFEQPRTWVDVYQHSDGIVQPLVFSVAQMKKELEEGNAFLREVIQTGLLLHGSRSLWKAIRELSQSQSNRRE